MIKRILNIIICFLLISSLLHSNYAQEGSGKFTNLGPQLYTSLIQGSVFADDTKGKSYVYTVVRGRPAHFVGFSIMPNVKVIDVELPGTDGSWDVETSSDGMVYIAGANGVLYSHQPGSDKVNTLGRVLPGEKVIWDLTAGKNGEIFGGTYPGCRVFRYHPKDGFSDVGKGALVENENYVRSVVYDKKSGKIYAGIASHSALVELDPKTGEKKQLLPDEDRDQEAVYHINLVNDLKGGDRVFGWLTGSKERLTVIYNLKTKKFEDTMPTIDVKSVIKSASGSKIYYSAGKKLYVLDYASNKKKAKELAQLSSETKTIRWGKDGLLYILTSSKDVHTYNTLTNKLTTERLAVPEQPIDIQSIFCGPDGNVWTGGYLAGGHASYNPLTGKSTQYQGLDQTEGMTSLGSILYFGIYPKSRLYAYDTQKPWDLKQKNPKFLGQIPEQDRPFAVLGLEKLNSVLFGTVPTYGHLGGALINYDVTSEQLQTFNNIIPNQSVISLAKHNELVIGGTSIFGGLGGVPKEKEAKLFGWNPETKKKVFEIVPVKGAMSLSGLINGPDGHIWGFADGDLIIFDPVQQKVISKKELFRIGGMPSHIWRSAFMEVHPNGNVYCAVNRKLYKINPGTLEITAIQEDVSLLTMGENGTLYFRRNSDLWSYQP